MSKFSGRELYISTTTPYINGKIMLLGRGYIDPPHVLKLSGRGYIDNDDIHTRENNVIEEGVYRPPLVLKLSGGVYIDDDRPDKTYHFLFFLLLLYSFLLILFFFFFFFFNPLLYSFLLLLFLFLLRFLMFYRVCRRQAARLRPRRPLEITST